MRNTEWKEDKWNSDYRINRKNTVDSGTAPCITNCPAHIPVQGYVKLASQGKYTEALELIKKHNPLPAVCGRICPKLCEDDCTRGDIDEAVAVDDIKKFIAQQDLNKETRFIPRKRHDYSDKKVAIIGAGPAGLTCAYDLAIDGYDITVFEKQEMLGGMLTLGIPSYRLEKNVIGAEIDVIKEMGVKFKTGVEVGKDITIQKLRDQGFNAFYLAIGAHAGRTLGIDGEDAEEVLSGVDFLRTVNLGETTPVKGKTIVIGGGNVAIDVARTAVRLGGVSQVDLFCLEELENMPAHIEEIEEAMSEDIVINNSWGPSKIIREGGKVTGVEFKRCLAIWDARGKFNPHFDERDKKIVACDYVLLSVGQTFNYGTLLEGEGVELAPQGTIKVDPITQQTSKADIFAGGDVAIGPRFAIDAIAAGKEGAVSLHRFVQNGQSLVFGRDTQSYIALDKEKLMDIEGYDGLPRQKTHHVNRQEAKTTFKDLRGTLTETQIKKETLRCLSCGVTKIDEYACIGCGACTVACKFDAIKLERIHDVKGFHIDDLPKTVIKNTIKRKVKITANKLNPFAERR